MSATDDLFKRLEKEIELPPGTKVLYEGSMLAAHGLWVVHSHVDDIRVTLRAPEDEHVRLNAHKSDLTVVVE